MDQCHGVSNRELTAQSLRPAVCGMRFTGRRLTGCARGDERGVRYTGTYSVLSRSGACWPLNATERAQSTAKTGQEHSERRLGAARGDAERPGGCCSPGGRVKWAEERADGPRLTGCASGSGDVSRALARRTVCASELSGIDRRTEEARLACLAHDFGRSTGTIVFSLVVPASGLVLGTAALIVSMPSQKKR